MAELKVECSYCGANVTEILATHTYTISYDEDQEKWVRGCGDVVYVCGNCMDELDSHDIEDVLRQVDEL